MDGHVRYTNDADLLVAYMHVNVFACLWILHLIARKYGTIKEVE